jgi:hypothetical protein
MQDFKELHKPLYSKMQECMPIRRFFGAQGLDVDLTSALTRKHFLRGSFDAGTEDLGAVSRRPWIACPPAAGHVGITTLKNTVVN